MMLLEVFNPYSVILVGTGITVVVQGREAWMLADFFGSVVIGLMFFCSPRVSRLYLFQNEEMEEEEMEES